MVTLSLVIKMNKKTGLLLAIFIVLLIGIGIFFYFQNMSSTKKDENDYAADRTSTTNTTNETPEKQEQNNLEVKQGITDAQSTPPVTEEQIATFSTKIYSNDSARQNNITITCNTLNETIVKNGETFSFCGTVGQASTSKGYQKADIFDKDGNKKKGLGGR